MQDKKLVLSNLESHFQALKSGNATRFVGGAEGAQIGSGGPLSSEDIGELRRKHRKRVASMGAGGGTAGQITSGAGPKIQSPFYQRTNLALPLDRITRNQWSRFYYRHEPYVKSAIDLHSQFPISDFENSCSDSKVKEFFDDMVFNELDIMSLLLDIGSEYWKLGDVFPMGSVDETSGTWSKFTLLNPDYVDVQTNMLANDPLITYVPDQDLRAIVAGGPRGPMGELFRSLSPQIINAVRRNENIPLSPLVVSHLANKASRYEVWGTPLIQSVFKVLLYKDKLREAQQAIADRFITPLRIFKVGSPGGPQPSQEELQDLRGLLEDLEYDPTPVLVYHSELEVTGTDFASRLLQMSNEFGFIKEELLIGLMMSESLITGTESIPNPEAQIGNLRRRYLKFRSMITRWMERSVYAPIAELQEFYQPEPRELVGRFRSKKKEEKRLLYPRVAWHGKDMIDEDSARQLYLELQSRGLISLKSMLPKFGLNYFVEMRNIKSEQQQMEKGDFEQDDSLNMGSVGGGTPPSLPSGDMEGLSIEDALPSIDPDGAGRDVSPEVGTAPPPGNESAPTAASVLQRRVTGNNKYSGTNNKYSSRNSKYSS